MLNRMDDPHRLVIEGCIATSTCISEVLGLRKKHYNEDKGAIAIKRRIPFRRANITWRQEVGGSTTEASKIAGHAHVQMSSEQTLVGIERQQELTQATQRRLQAAAGKVEEKRKQQVRAASAGTGGADDFERFIFKGQ